MITKAERAELRSIVRQQFKVLRSELEQRKFELLADVEDEISARFADDDARWAGVEHRIQEAVLAANREINNALYEGGYLERRSTEKRWVSNPQLVKPDRNRSELRAVARSRIEAQTKAACLQLERQEADLLKSLAVGAIESDEARAFLSAIPTVGELVPAARLAELEASLGADQ